MARNLGETTVTIPVLDRLIDLEPGSQTENPPSRSQSERLLKRAVRRDLEWLLNTRRISDLPDEGLKEVNRSGYMYGLPDLSTLTMATAGDRNKLLRQIQAAVNLFEPRLANVRLTWVENPDTVKSEVRLRIEAMLRMDPSPEPISFDTVIELKAAVAASPEVAMRDDLLLYYERELDYLRKSAVQFAEKHPKVASRLVLEPTKCEDPHVERLLEAFALLAARVHLKLDDEFPEITQALLTVVYPQLVRPLPSMSVVEFQLDPEKGKLTSGLKIDRHTPLYSKPVGGVPCTFRTCYDTTLWPLTVTAAEWRAPSRLQPAVKTNDSAWAIRLELQCAPDINFQGLKIDQLRFYLDGESGLVNILYELLFSRLNRVMVRDLSPGSRLAPVTLPASALSPAGFAPDQGMVPYAASSFSGHRLLMEYFAFPEKFFFIDLTGLEAIAAAGFKSAVEVVFLISQVEGDGRIQRLELELSKKTFRLGCTPIVNLFPQVAEPIQLDRRKYEYTVTPDVRRPHSMEVFSIDEVGSIDSTNQKITTYEPFYSLRHSAQKDNRSCFWLARRRPSSRLNDEGTEVALSLIDLSTANVDAQASVLSVRTTCTNRDLPSRLPFGNQDSDFEMEGAAAMKRIVALRKPTQPVRPELGKSTLWRLVSHLSLNYLSLVEQGKDALKEILGLYDVGRTAYSQNVIQSILEIRSRPHFTRLISEQGVSFARGLRIEMELDEDQFTGGGAFLFANVLERFFGLSVSLNSFTQLSVTTPQRKGVLHEWQPRSGRKLLV